MKYLREKKLKIRMYKNMAVKKLIPHFSADY